MMATVDIENSNADIPPESPFSNSSELPASTLATMDSFSLRLRNEALDALREEPELYTLLHRTVLAPGVVTFEEAVASTVCYRLLQHPCDMSVKCSGSSSSGSSMQSMFCPNSLKSILLDAMKSPETEGGHTMSESIREDAIAVCQRDPACETLLEVVLFYKGYAALVCHRAARRKWNGYERTHPTDGTGSAAATRRSFTALFLQSQASAVFGLDIHPAATIGKGILLDHGTGVVIGETATLGDGCTLLHGVTLGGTGKDHGDRHPKVGKNVLIGAGASILGNIPVGDGAKIGAGSIVLRPIPAGATAVGAPAKIIGKAIEERPGEFMDDTLKNVAFLHKSESSATVGTTTTSSSDDEAPDSDQSAAEDFLESDNDNDNKSTNKHKNDNKNNKIQGDEHETTGHPTDHSEKQPPHPQNETQEQVNNNNGSGKYDCSVIKAAMASAIAAKAKAEKNSHYDEDYFCPFRDYRKISETSPKDSVTICKLFQLLAPPPFNCPPFEISSAFLELDVKNVGYISLKNFKSDSTIDTIVKYCTPLQQQKEQKIEQLKSAISAFCASIARDSTDKAKRTSKHKQEQGKKKT